MESWIGVDLDGTLAEYTEWKGEFHIGKPIPLMVERVKRWISGGHAVRIFTARAYNRQRNDPEIQYIRDWCHRNIGCELEVTCTKDYGMIELWDDRAIRVECNTGRIL